MSAIAERLHISPQEATPSEFVLPTMQDAIAEVKKEGSLEFGAFIQVLQKSGNNISYISYGLPKDIPPDAFERMMVKILYPEEHFQGDISTEKFAVNQLQILSRPGLHIDAVDRMLSVPRSVLASDHPDHESYSMLKYYKNYQYMHEEFPDIKKKFVESVFAANPKAKVADGFHIHHGAYEFIDEEAIGLNFEGTERFNLLKLANNPETQKQMEAMVGAFRENEAVTVVLVDSGPSVIDCRAGCAKYFELRAQQYAKEGGYFDPTEAKLFKEFNYQVNFIGPGLIGGEMIKINICKNCKHAKQECECISYEVSAGGEN